MSFFNEPAFDEPKTNSIENTLGTSLRYQVPKLFSLLLILYILEQICSISAALSCLVYSPCLRGRSAGSKTFPEEVRTCLTKYWKIQNSYNPKRTVSLSVFSLFISRAAAGNRAARGGGGGT